MGLLERMTEAARFIREKGGFKMSPDHYPDRFQLILQAVYGEKQPYLFDSHLRSLQAKGDAVYLDLGCGDGTALLEFAHDYPGIRYYGMDFNKYGLESKIAEAGITKYTDWAEELERYFGKKSLDFITGSNSFMWFNDPFGVLLQCYSVLKEGGIAVANRVPLDACLPIKHERTSLLNYLSTEYDWSFIPTASGSYEVGIVRQSYDLELPMKPNGRNSIVELQIGSGKPYQHPYSQWVYEE